MSTLIIIKLSIKTTFLIQFIQEKNLFKKMKRLSLNNIAFAYLANRFIF